jgi:hypothetical protein
MTSPKQHPASNSDARKRAEETALGAEYAASLGLHLSVDEQRARFKRSTEGAPLVQRPLRRQPVPECVVSADERPPVNQAARQALAMGAVLTIVALTVAVFVYALGSPPT